MLTENCCTDCVSILCELKLEETLDKNFFLYFSNEAKIRHRSIVVKIIVIKTPLFDYWCDNSLFEALWEDARCKRRLE